METPDYLDIIDNIDNINLLLRCVELITKDRDFLNYTDRPHEALIMTIRDKLEDIQKDLYKLGAGDEREKQQD